MQAQVRIGGHDDFGRLARRLRAAGARGLQRRLNSEVRRVGGPAVTAVRAAWGTVDVTSSAGGGDSSGLRARVAAATEIEVTGSGIRVRVRSAQVDPDFGRQLVYGLDALHHWFHPVFGREPYVSQRGEEVFYSTLERFAPEWRAGIIRAMEDVARQIG